MKRVFFSFFTIIIFMTTGARAQSGSWASHLAYTDVTDIELAQDMVYVLASNNLFSYNLNDNSIQVYDKINILNDCGISKIAYNGVANKLMIIYNNQNIDLLSNNETIENISSLYSKDMSESKKINSIYIYKDHAYLAAGFGILNIDMNNAYIKETYNLGFNIDTCYISAKNIYAASASQGLYTASLSDNLSDKNNWYRLSDYSLPVKNSVIAYDSKRQLYFTKDDDGGIYSYKIDNGKKVITAQKIKPDGPIHNFFGFMQVKNGVLYSCGSGFSAYTEQMRNGTIQILNNDTWTFIGDDIYKTSPNTFVDMDCVEPNPGNPSCVMAGGRTGLYMFVNGKLVNRYGSKNSPLSNAYKVNDDYFTLVNGIKYTNDGTLWCLNSQSTNVPLLSLSPDLKWNEYKVPELMYQNTRSLGLMKQMIQDSRGLLWFVNSHYDIPHFYSFNPQTHKITEYKNFQEEDGTSIGVMEINDVKEDLDHNIWVATNNGPLVVKAEYIQQDIAIAQHAIVPRNDGTNFADYLLNGVSVTGIAIDGGGNKWFVTRNNGAFLVSRDNTVQLQHFTETNSNIFSNNIESVAYNGVTGRVFFGTDKGLCSYLGVSTDAKDVMNEDDVIAYPNPVPPNYSGNITITGLSLMADVKILTVNGVLIAQGKSNGGSFVWDGKDMNNNPVASGVYFVNVATSKAEKGVVCKVAIVR